MSNHSIKTTNYSPIKTKVKKNNNNKMLLLGYRTPIQGSDHTLNISMSNTAKMHWLFCQYNQVIVGYIRLCERFNRSFIKRDSSAFVLLVVSSYPKGFTTRYNPHITNRQPCCSYGKQYFNLVFLSCTEITTCLLYTSPSPRDGLLSRMPSSA